MKKVNKENRLVFIVNDGYHDYSPAKKFGKIVFMSSDPSGISQFQTSTMARLFQPYINKSKKEDFIVVTGYTVMIAVFASMFAAKHKRINLLIYKPGENYYEVRVIKMKGDNTEVSDET